MSLVLFGVLVFVAISILQRAMNHQWLAPGPIPDDVKDAISEQIKARIPKTIKFHGGPRDGDVERMAQDSPFGFMPYTPKEEDERQQIGEINGQPLFASKIAYYQAMTDEDYFYVRDVSEEEARYSAMTGKPPEVKVVDSE